jgi:hypothetical protein
MTLVLYDDGRREQQFPLDAAGLTNALELVRTIFKRSGGESRP